MASIPSYLKHLNSLLEQQNDIQIIQCHVDELLEKSRDPSPKEVVGLLVDFFLRTKSNYCLKLLASLRENHQKVFFERCVEALKTSNAVVRGAALEMLVSLVQLEPIWLHHVVTYHKLLAQIFYIIKHDGDVTKVFLSCVFLIVLMPRVPSQCGDILSQVYDSFSTVAALCTRQRTAGHTRCVNENEAKYLNVALMFMFRLLYGMFPCGFIAFLRATYGSKDLMERNFQIFTDTIRPILNRTRVHPLLITGSESNEFSSVRWRGLRAHDIVTECDKYYEDPVENNAQWRSGHGRDHHHQRSGKGKGGGVLELTPKSVLRTRLDPQRSPTENVLSPVHVDDDGGEGNVERETAARVEESGGGERLDSVHIAEEEFSQSVEDPISAGGSAMEVKCEVKDIAGISGNEGELGGSDSNSSGEHQVIDVATAGGLPPPDADGVVNTTAPCAFAVTTGRLTAGHDSISEHGELPDELAISEAASGAEQIVHRVRCSSRTSSNNGSGVVVLSPRNGSAAGLKGGGNGVGATAAHRNGVRRFVSPAACLRAKLTRSTSCPVGGSGDAAVLPLAITPTAAVVDGDAMSTASASPTSETSSCRTPHDVYDRVLDSVSLWPSSPEPLRTGVASSDSLEEESLSNLSPSERLEKHLKLNCDALMRDLTALNAQQPHGDDIRLKTEYTLLYCYLLYERHRKKMHIERNRRLLEKVKKISVLQEENKLLRETIDPCRDEVASLRAQVERLEKRLQDHEREASEHSDALYRKYAVLSTTVGELQEVNSRFIADIERLREELKQERDASMKARHLSTELQHELSTALKHCQEAKFLRQQLAFYEKELMGMQELYMRLSESQMLRSQPENQLTKAACHKELQHIKAVLEKRSKALERETQKVKYLNEQLDAKNLAIGDLKQQLNREKELHSQLLASKTERVAALRHIVERLETDMEQLRAEMEVDRRHPHRSRHTTGSRAIDMPHSRPEFVGGAGTGVMMGISSDDSPTSNSVHGGLTTASSPNSFVDSHSCQKTPLEEFALSLETASTNGSAEAANFQMDDVDTGMITGDLNAGDPGFSFAPPQLRHDDVTSSAEVDIAAPSSHDAANHAHR